ncbi:hypothetical protein MC378_06490 [Polaribacter sp. MSW13]|uniref:Uncharacterized protein n=1 Tax=Polaribacter marinus TaxID=2916838 RepID=A0A9X2AL22_9FLAO|nr:hypothetical protein [Polaribacter marinus]MCI2228810.1 hypothetical protein [Polaribacter marinus]
MSLLTKIQKPEFWPNFLKIALPFFIIVTLISLFMNSWREIFAGDFATVSKVNFEEGKWMSFFGIKVVISFVYGLYVTNKNMK